MVSTPSIGLEPYTWIIILGAWSLLLLLGLAGGDPLAAGQPGREAPAVALVKWAHRAARRRRASAGARAPRPAMPMRPSESGLHAVS